MKTRVIAGGTVLMLLGIAAVEASPPTPTRTPAPGARDSAGPPPETGLSDATAQSDAIDRSIESLQKAVADQQADIAALNAQIQELNKKIEQQRQMLNKLKKDAAALGSQREQQAAAKLSKKISEQEVRAQELRASLVLRLTPAPKKPAPKP
jgi:septal ring factor EnvC (AmiA/AmiB activator)